MPNTELSSAKTRKISSVADGLAVTEPWSQRDAVSLGL